MWTNSLKPASKISGLNHSCWSKCLCNNILNRALTWWKDPSSCHHQSYWSKLLYERQYHHQPYSEVKVAMAVVSVLNSITLVWARMCSSRFNHHLKLYNMDTVWPFISTSPSCLATVLDSCTGERHDTMVNCNFEFHSVFSFSENQQPTQAKQEPIVFSPYCWVEIICPSPTDLESPSASLDQSCLSDSTNLAKNEISEVTSTCGINSVLRWNSAPALWFKCFIWK